MVYVKTSLCHFIQAWGWGYFDWLDDDFWQSCVIFVTCLPVLALQCPQLLAKLDNLGLSLDLVLQESWWPVVSWHVSETMVVIKVLVVWSHSSHHPMAVAFMAASVSLVNWSQLFVERFSDGKLLSVACGAWRFWTLWGVFRPSSYLSLTKWCIRQWHFVLHHVFLPQAAFLFLVNLYTSCSADCRYNRSTNTSSTKVKCRLYFVLFFTSLTKLERIRIQ